MSHKVKVGRRSVEIDFEGTFPVARYTTGGGYSYATTATADTAEAIVDAARSVAQRVARDEQAVVDAARAADQVERERRQKMDDVHRLLGN